MSEETNISTESEKPQANWATWALLREAFKPGVLVPGSVAEFCVHRLHRLVGQDPDVPVPLGKRTFVVVTNCGHWGRGNTLEAAAIAAHKVGARKTSKAFVVLVVNDDTPEVNQGGCIISNSDSDQFNIGWVGTVGGILNSKE